MSGTVKSVLNVDRLSAVRKPFPHAMVDGFFEPGLFQELREQFPQITTMQRPPGWGQSLYWGEEDYEQHLEGHPAWQRAFEMVQSQEFISFIVDQFRDLWAAEGCTLDLSKARYVPWIESRSDKERNELAKVEHEPHELWCRMDFYESYGGYYRPIHLDQRRRLISMLVYFDDKEEIGMQGGDLQLHRSGPDLQLMEKAGMYHAPKIFSRVREQLIPPLRISPRRNRMAMFLCGRRSWHSVPAVTCQKPRRHIHILISSSVGIWQ